MNNRLITPSLILPVLLAALPVGAQNLLTPPVPEPSNRFGVNFRMAFNVTADFKTEFGPGAALPAPGVAGVDRFYDDGYSRVDSTGNAGGYTRFWGYDHDSQYDAGNHTITMHSASGSTSADHRDDGLQMGLELTYSRELGRKEKFRWGVETALNYMNVSIHDNRPATVKGTLISDTHQLPPVPGGGYVIPPPAPYAGPYDTTGIGNPAIYDTPSGRATSTLNATSSGTRSFDADVIGWRVGPYLEFPVVTNLSFSLSGGFSLVGIFSDYRFNETITYHEPASSMDGLEVLVRGSGSQSGVLAGGYVGGGFFVTLDKGWCAFGGAQFQYAGSYTHREGVSQARLDLGKSIFVSLGAAYSF